MNTRHIFQVYLRDLRSAVGNPVALVIVLGIICLPALYAWVNIAACWNPYDRTGDIPVAIVNQDRGASFQGKRMRIGAEFVRALHQNHEMKWQFTTASDADMGLIDGTYYAEIQIPSDFSERFLSFLSDVPQRPQILYKVNTKVTPVANRITDTAKDALVTQISSEFLSAVDQTVLSYLHRAGKEAGTDRASLLELRDGIVMLKRSMPLVLAGLQNVQARAEVLQTFLTDLRAAVPASAASEMTVEPASVRTTLRQTAADLETVLDRAAADSVSLAAQSETWHAGEEAAVQRGGETLQQTLQELEESLGAADAALPGSGAARLRAKLQTLRQQENRQVQALEKLQQGQTAARAQLTARQRQISRALSDVATQYRNTVRPQLEQLADAMAGSLDSDGKLLGAAAKQDAGRLLQHMTRGSALAVQVSGDLYRRLIQYHDMIERVGNRLESVSDGDLLQMITILQTDPTLLSSAFSEPVRLQEEAIYPIPNYGSAMAPLYTVLALWVGTLVLTAVLKTEAPAFAGSALIGLRERYYGKLCTFLTFSLLQALVTTAGDRFLLHVYMMSPGLMAAVAAVSAATFTMITFTLTALLGNIGKAVSVVYLILQIAGAGGSYPIQVNPRIFRLLHPLFPFTYSLEGLREAIAGPVVDRVLLDFFALFLMQLCALGIGYVMRKPLYGPMRRFEARFRAAGIGEEEETP